MNALANFLYELREFVSPTHIAYLKEQFHRFGDLEIQLKCIGNPIESYVWNKQSLAYDVRGFDLDDGHEFFRSINFEAYLRREFEPYKERFERNLSIEFINTDPFQYKSTFKAMKIELEDIKTSAKKSLEEKHFFLIDLIDDWFNFLLTKYKMENSLTPTIISAAQENPKIIWTRKLNKLTTFFIHMQSGEKTNYNPLIKCDDDEIVNLIYNNFCDENGNRFHLKTIKDYFTGGKKNSKQAKGKNAINFDENGLVEGRSKHTLKKISEKPLREYHIPKKIN